MPRKLKALAVNDGTTATADADTFILRAGDVKVIDGFDAAHDRVMFDVNHSYSDILTLDPFDGFVTFSGATLSLQSVDYNHDGIADALVSLSGVDGTATAVLLGVDLDSLHGWNLAGG